MSINPGDVVTVETDPVFTNVAGQPDDPGTVTFIFYRRGEPPTTRTCTGGTSGGGITRTGIGRYQSDILVDKKGKWFARWAGDGDPQAAEETSFDVVSNFGG